MRYLFDMNMFEKEQIGYNIPCIKNYKSQLSFFVCFVFPEKISELKIIQ